MSRLNFFRYAAGRRLAKLLFRWPRVVFIGFCLIVCADGKAALIGWYKFDDQNKIGADSSGSGNDGTVMGSIALTTGVSGSAIEIPTSNGGFLEWPNVTQLFQQTLSSNYSVAAWVRTTRTAPVVSNTYQGQTLVWADAPGAGGADTFPISIVGGSGGGFVDFGTGGSNGSSDSRLVGKIKVNDGKWHHIAVTRNAATGEKKVYIDGVIDVQGTAAQGGQLDASAFRLGYSETAGNPFVGQVDDFRIYDSVLSQLEVQSIMANPSVSMVLGYPKESLLTKAMAGSVFPGRRERR